MPKMSFLRKNLVSGVAVTVLLASLSVASFQSIPASAASVVSTDWLVGAKYGISVHWTSQSVPQAGGSPVAYCTAVSNFDVNNFANQVADSGAGFVIFTISHAQMYFAFPSPTLDAIISGRTCTRDLYSDIYNAISPKGIKMMFYFPSIGVNDDPAWQAASGWNNSNKTTFVNNQYNLVNEVGQRYGTKLAGWWVDNQFDGTGGIPNYASYYNYNTYATSLRAGNPNRIITFNYRGQSNWGSTLGQGIEDYQAGESTDLSRTPSSRYSGEGSTQWFTWLPIDDDNWVHASASTKPDPKYSDASLIKYVKDVNANQGVVTFNAAPFQDTLISAQTMKQLRSLKAALRENKTDDTAASYTGTWLTTASNPNYFGNYAHYSTTAGNYAQYTFNGTSVTWHGVAGPDHGKADVYIDGTFDQTVDCYTAGWTTQALYSKSGLSPSTSHTIKIVVRSDRNPSATNNFVELDALEAIYQWNSVDDASAAYTGSWQTIGSNSKYYGSSAHYSTTAGSYAQYTFNGTGVIWYGVTNLDHGKADVYIDGTFDQTVDCYSALTWQTTSIYTKKGLSNGSHTLKIVIRSDRNPASTNNYIEVDALAYFN